MKKFLFIGICLAIYSCNSDKAESEYSALKKELQETKSQLEMAKKSSNYQPGLIHTVFFWLKEDLSPKAEAEFLDGLKSLHSIKSVKAMHIGPPAPTQAREVVDHSFNYAATYYFDDIEGQNAYQTDPIHVKFAADIKDKLIRVLVYDHLVAE